MRRKLTEAQLMPKAEQLAEAVAELRGLRLQAKKSSQQWKARIDAVERRIEGLALSVRTKTEEAEQTNFDLVTGEVAEGHR